MNKYHQILQKVLAEGKCQQNRKGSIRYLLNERLVLSPADLLDIFEGHGIARKKLKNELQLFMQGETQCEEVSRGGHQLVGLLRCHSRKLLPYLL